MINNIMAHNMSNNIKNVNTAFLKKEPEEPQNRITKEFLKKLLRSDIKQYYCTPELNDILYLHYKGFEAIENLEQFTELKVLYIEGNAISKIENLGYCSKLKCLYLQENLVKKIENLENLEELVSLNLSDNLIEVIEGLGNNKQLENLQLKRNRIGIHGLSDISHLRELKSVSALDLSNNNIDCENYEDFIQIIESMDSLAVLYLQNNPICKKIPNYRKTLISKLKNLKYLDDRPVFPEDRRFAEAFCKGGLEEEKNERQKYKDEEEEKHRRQHEAFRARFITKTPVNLVNNENDSDVSNIDQSVNTSKLETYYSEDKSESKLNQSDSISNKSLKDDMDNLSIKSDKETKSLVLEGLEELD